MNKHVHFMPAVPVKPMPLAASLASSRSRPTAGNPPAISPVVPAHRAAASVSPPLTADARESIRDQKRSAKDAGLTEGGRAAAEDDASGEGELPRSQPQECWETMKDLEPRTPAAARPLVR